MVGMLYSPDGYRDELRSHFLEGKDSHLLYSFKCKLFKPMYYFLK